jgi:hypothetical protein
MIRRRSRAVEGIELRNEEFVSHSDTFKRNTDGTVSLEGRVIVQLRGDNGQWYIAERVLRLRARRDRRKL